MYPYIRSKINICLLLKNYPIIKPLLVLKGVRDDTRKYEEDEEFT
jgi:hypothetical protein